jgi:hypothetical protein
MSVHRPEAISSARVANATTRGIGRSPFLVIPNHAPAETERAHRVVERAGFALSPMSKGALHRRLPSNLKSA